MTDRDDLRKRLDAVEEDLAPAETVLVTVLGPGDRDDYPPGVTPSDVTRRWEEPGIDPNEPLVVEETIVPIHRPPEFRGGIVVMTGADAARIFDSMPPSIVDRERQLREEWDKPTPPVIQP
jgi:hypothetical protein